MKFTLSQLSKIDSPIKITYKVDFMEYLDKLNDVNEISEVLVNGEGYALDDGYVFSLNIKTTLKMICAVTLETVIHNIDINVDEVFVTENQLGDDVNLITNGELDLDPVVLANIILAIPLKVVKKGAENIFKASENHETKLENPFHELKDYFKK